MVGFTSDGVIVYMRLKISVGMGMKMGGGDRELAEHLQDPGSDSQTTAWE